MLQCKMGELLRPSRTCVRSAYSLCNDALLAAKLRHYWKPLFVNRIAVLNDAFRTSFVGRWVVFTPGILALPWSDRDLIVARVRAFDTFTPDNDPYGEHDFGSFDLLGKTIFWKIDAYDVNLEFGSPDPTDPAVTRRVLTILLAEEY